MAQGMREVLVLLPLEALLITSRRRDHFRPPGSPQRYNISRAYTMPFTCQLVAMSESSICVSGQTPATASGTRKTRLEPQRLGWTRDL